MKLNWCEQQEAAGYGVVSAVTKKTGTRIFRQKSHGGLFSSSWYMRKTEHGANAYFSLGKAPAEAIRIADEIAAFLSIPGNTLEMAQVRYSPKALSRPGRYASIGDVLEVHKANVNLLELGERTARGYYNSLCTIVRRVDCWRKGEEFVSIAGKSISREEETAAFEAQSTSVLTEKLLLDYQRAMVDDGDDDEEDLLTAKISANSAMRNARALFGVEAMKCYREKHLSLPDMSGFMGVSYFKAEKFFELPSARVVDGLFTQAELLRARRPDVFKVWFAAIHCGLRRSEIAALSPAWIEQHNDTAILKLREKGAFRPKHGHGRTVVLQAWVADELCKLAASPSSYMGEESSARDAAFVQAVEWLRSAGIEAAKPLHELRKLWTCAKVKTEGMLAAQQQAGHRDANTTSKFYADNKLPEALVAHWTKQHTA